MICMGPAECAPNCGNLPQVLLKLLVLVSCTTKSFLVELRQIIGFMISRLQNAGPKPRISTPDAQPSISNFFLPELKKLAFGEQKYV